jgi:hypothetical protein
MNEEMNMRKFFLAGAALSLLGLAIPASAMPVGKIAPGLANDEAGVVQVRYRHRSRAYYYRPRARYVYRNYDYDDGYGYPVRRSYGYYGGDPYYGGGYGGGYYGGGPSIGFSFGTGGW